MTKRILFFGICVAVLGGSLAGVGARQGAGAAVPIDPDDIGGVVTSAKGPEAGVWVIAETRDLPTKFSRSVVTDDKGQYVIPDLPKAGYEVFVRGYGLVDSPRVKAVPGKNLNLTAVVAPNPRAAAEVYPAQYWFAMIDIPAKSEFPLPEKPSPASQAQFIRALNTDTCISCHQIGNKPTREIRPELGTFASSIEAWARRVRSGHDGNGMDGQLNGLGRNRALKMFADWTDRIAKGEYPPVPPPRPQGVERNIVITQWDWADPREYFHDVIASDKRNPTVNPYGPVYGLHENSSDHMTILEPTKHSWSQVTIPRNPNLPPVPAGTGRAMAAPSPYWGNEIIWNTVVTGHSNEMDQKGRTWNTTSTRTAALLPDYCKEGSSNPSAKLVFFGGAGGRGGGGRQYTVWDPVAKKFDIVDTCFGTFHLNFDNDPNNTIYSGGGAAVGWVNTNLWDKTKDAGLAQGWTAQVVDTNGNGRRDEYTEGETPLDPTKDRRITPGCYGVMPSPADNSVWCSQTGFPGSITRIDMGPDMSKAHEVALTEIYQVPYNDPRASGSGYGPRGMDVDRDGVAWVVISSGHLASFDRRKCKGPLNGPKAVEGKMCPEGWTLYPVPGPKYKGDVDHGTADSNYYNWSDKFNALGLGENVQIATSNQGGALLALVNGKWVIIRVPYPLGYYAKSINGRIDDPKAGWKGRGLWTGWGNRNPWHNEGGKGQPGIAVHMQVRPNPLAK
jgi:hypothetical protein